MAKRTPPLGLAVALVVATALTVSVQQDAGAIPANAPKTGMVCTPGSLAGGTRTFNLVAKTGHIETPDGNSVFMWSYANADAPDNGAFQSPGPVLCANQGETVAVNLTNNLGEPSSVIVPGQDSPVSSSGGSAGLLTQEAGANGGTVSYSFQASQPGTYLYESGSDPVKQDEMGLYGALVIRPSIGAGYAYGADTQFDPAHEYLMLLADIDPALHHAVEIGATYDFNALRDRYYTINGRSFPDTIQDNGSALLPYQPYGALVRIQPNTAGNPLPSLVRMITVGSSNHPFHPHGNHTVQIAQDGRTVARTEHFGETIGSGQTEDFLLRWDDQDHWDPVSKPFPVTQPNYRNLTFKDGNTFYSGSPYLGYKGTLPTGTVSQNVCGEWYFPWHSHALNEFTNFDEGFGGMGTLLRVDPPGGCFTVAASTSIGNGTLQSGAVGALAAADNSFYKVNAKTTTSSSAQTSGATTLNVSSAAGFPTAGNYYVRVGTEVERVTGGQGTTSWTVVRHTLGTNAAAHASGATVTSLSTDWYAGFTGVPAGAANLKVTYAGRNCSNTSGNACNSPAVTPQQVVSICNWSVACTANRPAGWVTLPAPPAQPQAVGGGASDVASTWTIPGSGSQYVGTGANKGQIRILVHSQEWPATTPPLPAAFATWGNSMQLVYDAP
jgi:FtsP/CotA-like multicopper oxidase with cupredoxin domain